MMRSHFAGALSDAAFSEVVRQLRYKGLLAGSTSVVADRFFPSSKMCFSCGERNADLKVSERRWTCPFCGAAHERDENAAKNLYQLALAAAHAVTACRHESADEGS
jgi:putative transposase